MNAFTEAERFVEQRLVPPLIHGDKAHQEWIKSELRKWICDLADLLLLYGESVTAPNVPLGKETPLDCVGGDTGKLSVKP